MHQAAQLIRNEIARLQAALAILEPVRRGRPAKNPALALLRDAVAAMPKKRGRPFGSRNKAKAA